VGTPPTMSGVPGPRPLLTSAELAKALNVSVKTVQRWARAGRIRPTATTPGGQYRFALDDVLEQLNQPRPRDPDDS
jgi:excisionase family DNA binding protein